MMQSSARLALRCPQFWIQNMDFNREEKGFQWIQKHPNSNSLLESKSVVQTLNQKTLSMTSQHYWSSRSLKPPLHQAHWLWLIWSSPYEVHSMNLLNYWTSIFFLVAFCSFPLPHLSKYVFLIWHFIDPNFLNSLSLSLSLSVIWPQCTGLEFVPERKVHNVNFTPDRLASSYPLLEKSFPLQFNLLFWILLSSVHFGRSLAFSLCAFSRCAFSRCAYCLLSSKTVFAFDVGHWSNRQTLLNLKACV